MKQAFIGALAALCLSGCAGLGSKLTDVGLAFEGNASPCAVKCARPSR